MKVKSEYILRELAGQNIVVPIGSEAVNFNGVITLNNSGKRLFKKLKEETTKEIDPAKAKETYNQSNKDISVLGLPSAPKDYYAFHEDPTRPQPRMERTVGDGMTTTIGRVEKEELFDNGLKYMLFSHNKKMGSAKGAVLLAEMLYKKGKI